MPRLSNLTAGIIWNQLLILSRLSAMTCLINIQNMINLNNMVIYIVVNISVSPFLSLSQKDHKTQLHLITL